MIPLEKFTWLPESRTLVAERSDLRGLNPKSKQFRYFRLVERVRDREGEVMSDEYVCTADPSIKLSILND